MRGKWSVQSRQSCDVEVWWHFLISKYSNLYIFDYWSSPLRCYRLDSSHSYIAVRSQLFIVLTSTHTRHTHAHVWAIVVDSFESTIELTNNGANSHRVLIDTYQLWPLLVCSVRCERALEQVYTHIHVHNINNNEQFVDRRKCKTQLLLHIYTQAKSIELQKWYAKW